MEAEFYNKGWVPNFDVHPPASEAALECAIVEPRSHSNLAPVLCNISCMFPYAALTILHSKENEQFVQDIIGVGNTNIKRICFTESNITVKEYNELMCTPSFWEHFQSPRVLIFQTDSGVRKNMVLRFMEFDYVGAPWHWPIYGDPYLYVGNGGFSLRNPRVMQKICSSFVRDPNYPDNRAAGEPEDTFYARILPHISEVNLPSYDVASMFSVEHNVHQDPMGFHQGFGFHPEKMVKEWIANTDPCKPSPKGLMAIKDTWLESESGRQWSSKELKQWMSLGIGSVGFRMPKDTKIACLPLGLDIDPGRRKFLHIVFDDHRLVRIPLYQNRCMELIQVEP